MADEGDITADSIASAVESEMKSAEAGGSGGGNATTTTTTATGDAPEGGGDTTTATTTATTGNTQTATAATWDAQPLPPELMAKYPGAKTYGDLDKKYTSGSRSVRELQQRVQELQRFEQQARELEQRQRQTQQQTQKPDFFGFQNADAFNAEFNKDPRGTFGKLLTQALRDPETVKSVFDPMLQERFAPIAQRETDERRAAMRTETFSRYPEFAPGTQGHDAARNYLDQNPEARQAFLEISEKFPSINVTEIITKAANYDLLAAQRAAAATQQKATAAKAVSARPSTGAKVAAKAPTLDEGVQQIAAEYGVSADLAKQLAATTKRALR